MPNRETPAGCIGRFALTVVVAALVAVVVVPSAAAIRFTDDSYQVPDGAVGSRYYHQFKGDGGCGPALPYQFRILNGALPPGLSLASNGLVSGTPTQRGNSSFWVELSDQDPPSADWCSPGSRSGSSRSTSGRRAASPTPPRRPVPEAAASRSTRATCRSSGTSATPSPARSRRLPPRRASSSCAASQRGSRTRRSGSRARSAS